MVVSGYVYIDGECSLIIHDPLPVNDGEIYFISHQKLVNGRNPSTNEYANMWIWEDSIVINTSYATSTIPYYFGQQ